jgi:hypothetical protein
VVEPAASGLPRTRDHPASVYLTSNEDAENRQHGNRAPESMKRLQPFIIADDQVTERADYTVLTPEGEQGGTSETIWHKQPDGSWKVTRLIVT